MPAPEVLELTSRWLRYAHEDLAAAEELLRQRLPARLTCFEAQQAAEKVLKAVFVLEQRDFPHTHDLVKLSEALPTGWSVTANTSELADLSRWAVQSR